MGLCVPSKGRLAPCPCPLQVTAAWFLVTLRMALICSALVSPHLCPVLGSLLQERPGHQGKSPTRIIVGLEHFCEEGLGELGLLSLEKNSLRQSPPRCPCIWRRVQRRTQAPLGGTQAQAQRLWAQSGALLAPPAPREALLCGAGAAALAPAAPRGAGAPPWRASNLPGCGAGHPAPCGPAGAWLDQRDPEVPVHLDSFVIL